MSGARLKSGKCQRPFSFRDHPHHPRHKETPPPHKRTHPTTTHHNRTTATPPPHHKTDPKTDHKPDPKTHQTPPHQQHKTTPSTTAPKHTQQNTPNKTTPHHAPPDHKTHHKTAPQKTSNARILASAQFLPGTAEFLRAGIPARPNSCERPCVGTFWVQT